MWLRETEGILSFQVNNRSGGWTIGPIYLLGTTKSAKNSKDNRQHIELIHSHD